VITATQAPEKYLEIFDQLSNRAATQPRWLQSLRQDAFARFSETGFPTTHDEDWRFTNVAAVANTAFELAGERLAGVQRAHGPSAVAAYLGNPNVHHFGHIAYLPTLLRALRKLVDDGRLVRLGYGVYGRATVSSLSGKPMLYSRDGFAGVARQALDKLGVKWEPTEAERAYNEGRSTQVPVNPVVRVKGRFSRHLRYRNAELVLER